MKAKILKFKDGNMAVVTTGQVFAKGANVEVQSGLQINKNDPMEEINIDVPNDFFLEGKKVEELSEKELGGVKIKAKSETSG